MRLGKSADLCLSERCSLSVSMLCRILSYIRSQCVESNYTSICILVHLVGFLRCYVFVNNFLSLVPTIRSCIFCHCMIKAPVNYRNFHFKFMFIAHASE
jgi:hypothetical protein